MYSWSPRSPKLEGTRPTHPIERLRLGTVLLSPGLDVVLVSVLVLQNRSCLGLHHWSGYQRRGPRGMSPNSRTKISGPGLGLELHSS